ncbi:MAG TPA: tetratricopeptide repeat protein [Aliidongia sp.]|nr:tetratricopeptide repeat protein [Aliidongia sp.]
MSHLGLAAVAGLVSGAALADADLKNDAASYERCMNTARKEPADGFEMASVWKEHGGGLPAEHCSGVALMGLKQYALAGDTLETLGKEMVREAPSLRAQVLSQAGEAWLQAGEPEKARADLTAAIGLDPKDFSLVVDRARAYAAAKDYKAAKEDLNRALTGGAPRGEVLTYRAAANRLLGDLGAARRDADDAVAAAPGSADAWLERANIRRLQHDDKGARADWIKVLQLAPDSPAGDAARDNLATMDVHVDGPPKQ